MTKITVKRRPAECVCLCLCVSYLPEEESQQAQQQQAQQHRQHDDPPRHSSVLGFKSLWEGSQAHLQSANTGETRIVSRLASNVPRSLFTGPRSHIGATFVSAFCRRVFLFVLSRRREAPTSTTA